jgi:hypothetical protein
MKGKREDNSSQGTERGRRRQREYEGPVWECDFNKCDFKNCVFKNCVFEIVTF